MTFVVLICASSFTFCQQHVWSGSLAGQGTPSAQIPSPGNSLCLGLAYDAQQNLYIAGQSFGVVDFDPGPAEEIRQGGNGDIFFAKYNASREHVWSHVLASAGYNRALDIATDGVGNVIITGQLESPVDLDPGPAERIMSPADGRSFLAKYDTDGDHSWSVQFDGRANKLAVDNEGNIHVTGTFGLINGTIDLQPGEGETLFSTTNGGVYFAKFDPAGNLIWANGLTGTGNLGFGSDISIGLEGHVLVAGSFGNTVDLDPGPGVYELTAETSSDRFFAMYDTDGSLLWGRGINVNGHWMGSSQENISIRQDHAGNVLITGNFKETVDFDPGPGTFYIATGLVFSSYFAKFTSTGQFIWAKAIHGGFCTTYDIEVDCDDNIYLTGSLSSADFDPGPELAWLQSNISGTTHFIARYDTDGNFLSVKQMGGSSSGPLSCTMTLHGEFVDLAGGFRYTQDFDPDSTEALLTMSGIGWNGYFARYLVRMEEHSDTTICKGDLIILDGSSGPDAEYLWQDGSTSPQLAVADSGLYSVRIQMEDCIKHRTFRIAYQPVPIFDLGNDTTLCTGDEWSYSIDPQGGTLLWQDGSTGSSYITTSAGTIWLQVTSGGCVLRDTIHIDLRDCHVAFQMPNVFTPNGDGMNDLLRPVEFSGIIPTHLLIYNRWGQQVYSSGHTLHGWDGRVAGSPAPAGPYYWVFSGTTIHDEAFNASGGFTLLR